MTGKTPGPGQELHARLARFVANSVRDPADAEDVLQDILLKLAGGEGPSEADKLLPWVFAVARNRVIDYHRARGRVDRRVTAIEEPLPDDVPEAPSGSPIALSGALDDLMEALSEQDRHVLRAVDLGGMSQKDYAASLGIDYTTAKSRVQRARKRLRREFERCCKFEFDRRGSPIACEPRRESDCC